MERRLRKSTKEVTKASKARQYAGFVNSKGVEAPAVEPHSVELGDKRLNVDEAVVRKREECLSMVANRRLGRQEELEDEERGSGPRLQFTEIISRLKCELPQLKVVDGAPGSVALYFPRTDAEFKEARAEWEWGRDEFFLYHKYVGGFPKQEIPEYSTIEIDTSLLPTREKRGWRSILITLLKQGVISYNAAVRQFGDVGTDRRGWRWIEQTHKWRQRPTKAFPQEIRNSD